MRRRDPRLGELSQAELSHQVEGITLVVLHPAVAPVEPRRAGQMNLRTMVDQQVDQPVVAEGGLQDHHRVLTSFRHGRHHLERVVEDPPRRQVTAIAVHPHDHRTAPVQIDPDILSFRHVGPSFASLPWFGHRECCRTRSTTRRRGPTCLLGSNRNPSHPASLSEKRLTESGSTCLARQPKRRTRFVISSRCGRVIATNQLPLESE